MPKQPPEIFTLPEEVASRIAAGEVVERPASALKEMLENSIDAGAENIEMEFYRGGKTFMKISDDGCGMTRNQALASLQQHATSKIRNADDIFSISSYGFRGEAVPSIASISRFVMRTRPHSQADGVRIEVDAGKIVDVRDCGMPPGTEITVEDIFCSVPARQKFLKSDAVEAAHILKVCKLYAAALPGISVSLREEGRRIFESAKGFPLLERLRRIYGADLAGNLIELEKIQRGGVAVSGAILKPAESFATAKNICFFINSRPVESRALFASLREAYTQFIPKGRYAAAFLFLEMDPRAVDVNVHPAKREVRLKDEFAVKDILFDCVSECLAKYMSESRYGGLVSDERKVSDSSQKIPVLPKIVPQAPTPRPRAEPAPAEPFPRRGQDWQPEQLPREDRKVCPKQHLKPVCAAKESAPICGAGRRENASSDGEESGAAAPKKSAPLPNWSFEGFFQKKYALFQTEKSLAIVSISAALKRVAYERITRSKSGKGESQKLLIVPVVRVEPADAECLKANMQRFKDCGFELEKFAKNFYRIVSIPAWLDVGAAENFVKDFIELARDESEYSRRACFEVDRFAGIAVRRIGAAGFECTAENAMKLLGELLSCKSHLSSPDGRPTIRELSAADFSRMFGR